MAIDPIWKAATAVWAGWTAARVKARLDAPWRIENLTNEKMFDIWEGLKEDEPIWKRRWDAAVKKDKADGTTCNMERVGLAMNVRINDLVDRGIVTPTTPEEKAARERAEYAARGPGEAAVASLLDWLDE